MKLKVLSDFIRDSTPDCAQLAHLLSKMPGTCQLIMAESSCNCVCEIYKIEHLRFVSKFITRLDTSAIIPFCLDDDENAADFGALPFPKLTGLVLDGMETLDFNMLKAICHLPNY